MSQHEPVKGARHMQKYVDEPSDDDCKHVPVVVVVVKYVSVDYNTKWLNTRIVLCSL